MTDPPAFPPAAADRDGTAIIPARSNTVGVWLIAFLPWMTLLVDVIVLVAVGIETGYWPALITALVLAFAALVAFAILDRAALARRGFTRRAQVGWVLLGPLGYLIVRTIRVRAQTHKGSPPLWALIANVVVIAVAGVVLVAAARSFLASSDEVMSIEQALRFSLAEKGQLYTISCPPFQRDFRAGSTFTCTAVDRNGIEGTITVTMITDGGRFRYELKPGAPAGKAIPEGKLGMF